MAGFDPNTLNQALAIIGNAPVYGQSPGLSGGGQMDPATAARLRKMAEQSGMAAQAQFAEDIPGGQMSMGAPPPPPAADVAGPTGGAVAADPAAATAGDDTIQRAQRIIDGKEEPKPADPVQIEHAPVTSEAEDGKKNQAAAMNKAGSALGAIANFYTGNWAGAVQSAQGMLGKNTNYHDAQQPQQQGGGNNAAGMMSMLGGLFGKKG